MTSARTLAASSESSCRLVNKLPRLEGANAGLLSKPVSSLMVLLLDPHSPPESNQVASDPSNPQDTDNLDYSDSNNTGGE